MYLDGLPQGEEAKNFKGKKLDHTVFEKVCWICFFSGPRFTHVGWTRQMSSEQLGQLYELMHASKDVWKPIPEESET